MSAASDRALASPLLLLAALATIVVAWQVPWGAQAVYPLTLLASYAHELGHGITALLVGARFERLLLYADASGLAEWYGSPGPLARAAIAAGGLLGPSVLGVALLLAAATPRRARWALGLLALLLAVSALLWVRNPFGLVFVMASALTLAAVARWLGDLGAAFVLHLVAAVLCLSWFIDLGYLFADEARVGGAVHRSDSAAIAAALGFPYWFWGAVVAALSLALLAFGLRVVLRRAGAGQPSRPSR